MSRQGMSEQEIREERKTMHLKMCDELAEEVLEGKVQRVVVVTMAPDGDLNVHAQGGFITDSVGMLQASIALLMQRALAR